MNKGINVGIIGASGLVGRTMLQVLLERAFPSKAVIEQPNSPLKESAELSDTSHIKREGVFTMASLRLFASARSAGTPIAFNNGRSFVIEELREDSFRDLDLALFSAGSAVSEQFVPIAVISDCVAIDNGSFWRMNKKVPLVVPEVNASALHKHSGIIANPNCSTIQLAVVLNALRQLGNLRRVLVSTYQSVSGGGQKLLDKFHSEMLGNNREDKYPIFNSIMFHSAFNAAGNTGEEAKMHIETRKILGEPDLKIDATCVRIPVEISHCEAVNVEFDSPVELNQIVQILSNTSGIVYIGGADYPTPRAVAGRDEVFVGRVRADNSNDKAVNLWIVADNLRKGAATNAVQIAEYVVSNNLLFNKF